MDGGSKPSASQRREQRRRAVGTVLTRRTGCRARHERGELYNSTMLRKSQAPRHEPRRDPSHFWALPPRDGAERGKNESRGIPPRIGGGFAGPFWSSGQDSGCAGITETRETGLFRATGKREHEVERGRKAPANRPKTRNFGLPRKYHGAEKTDLD